MFWNINDKKNGKVLTSIIAKLVELYDVDILMLAESQIQIDDLRSYLKFSEYFDTNLSLCSKIQIFTRFDSAFLKPIFEKDRYTIQRLQIPYKPEILLTVAHLPSQLYHKMDSLSAEVQNFSQQIKNAESREGHERTIVVGDLNLNPFDSPIISAAGLQGVMSQQIAQRINRTVQGEEYPFFYNPMWNFLGDRTKGPPGTYHYERAEHACYFWNMFDQVLIRPDLLDKFNFLDLQIIESVEHISLLNSSGLPDGKTISDHLPIFFKLNL